MEITCLIIAVTALEFSIVAYKKAERMALEVRKPVEERDLFSFDDESDTYEFYGNLLVHGHVA